MCFYIKVMHFKLVILTRVINQTPSYLIYIHFSQHDGKLHHIWPSASSLRNIIRREIYIWLKYSTSLLKLTVNITMTTEALREHDMLTWNDKIWTKILKENQFYCDGVSCSLETQICSHSFSDKHTAAWWIYWSLLEYKLTEKNNKFQFFFFTRQCKWKIVRHKGSLTTASHVKKVPKWLESFFFSLFLSPFLSLGFGLQSISSRLIWCFPWEGVLKRLTV